MKTSDVTQSIPYPLVTLSLFIVNILGIVAYFLIRNFLPPEVPLLYGLPYGQDQLVQKDLLVSPLIAAIFVIAINGILIKVTKDIFSQKVLLYTMVAATLLGIVTAIKIAVLVGGF